MLAVGRKEVELEKEDWSLLAEGRMREDGAFALPSVGSLRIDTDTAEQVWKCGVLMVPGGKMWPGSKRMIVWASEGVTGRALSGPLFSADTILAKSCSQTKGWSVCRFVLLSEKPSSHHALATREPVLGPHLAVPCFSGSDAGSPGEADLWRSWEVRAGPLHHELLNRSDENFCSHSFSAQHGTSPWACLYTAHSLEVPQPLEVPQDFAQCSQGGWREKLQKHRVVLRV